MYVTMRCLLSTGHDRSHNGTQQQLLLPCRHFPRKAALKNENR